jgi:signal transduction histidine kinase
MNGDPVLIQRLLANLINNAIEASSPGDTVHISASLHRGTQVAITVADRGCGVQPENIRRIFEPYFTTKDTGDDVRGIGLGLAICQKIADLHGGEIEVKNLSPKGTAFTVILPLRPESPGPNPATT